MGKVDPKIIKIVKEFKRRAEGKYNIKRMILFGSYANGKAGANSDIDLMVVTGKKDENIVAKLVDEWHMQQDISYPVDFVDYTNAEFRELAKRISLVKQVLETGVEV